MKAPDTIYIPVDEPKFSWRSTRESESDIAYVRLQAHADKYLPEILALERAVEWQRAEIVRLGIIERVRDATVEAQKAEIERLKKALEQYGWHDMGCQKSEPYEIDPQCNCGFSASLKGE